MIHLLLTIQRRIGEVYRVLAVTLGQPTNRPCSSGHRQAQAVMYAAAKDQHYRRQCASSRTLSTIAHNSTAARGINRLQKTGIKNIMAISPIEAEIADPLGALKAPR
jgi:hypothetical protein